MKFKSIILFVFLISMSVGLTGKAHAFFSWGGDALEKIADFPDTEQFKLNDDFIDAGIRYKEFEILFLPIYQYDFGWIGYVADSDIYYDLGRADLLIFANAAQVQLPDEIKLGFWKAWGGKLILVLVLVVYVGYQIQRSKEESEPSS